MTINLQFDRIRIECMSFSNFKTTNDTKFNTITHRTTKYLIIIYFLLLVVEPALHSCRSQQDPSLIFLFTGVPTPKIQGICNQAMFLLVDMGSLRVVCYDPSYFSFSTIIFQQSGDLMIQI